ncbi:MAG: 4-hydroxy-3-methylbut-2-enyl diphosphate reductase [Dehalococcoidia bacterium]|nr:4-hydroxy-3-methylbut-2-enyl diphosphate reductase [Dehalococcoidia bacterium]
MLIIVSRKRGFCAGVRRAIEMMERFAREEGPIETLGAIVHNPQIVEGLAAGGVTVANSLEEIRGKTAAITAHGMGPQVEEEAKRRGLRLVDATCPIVKKVHLTARDLAKAGYDIIIFGDPKHQEVRGIADWAGERVLATQEWPPPPGHGLSFRKIALLSQTTQGEEDYRCFISKVLESSLGRAREVRIVNTICGVTDAQKGAARELSANVDLMLVVGGHSSANTRHLAETCARTGVETHHIETAAELDPAWLAGKEKVGVTAGTSTPDWVIEEVVAALEAAGVSPPA